MIDRATQMRKRDKAILIGTTVLFVLIAYCHCLRYGNMLYHTHDDSGIQNCLSGFFSGVNDPAHQFISIFLGCPLSLLYKAFPSVQWWYMYSQFMMAMGGVLVVFVLLSHGLESRLKRVVAICSAVEFLLAFFIPAVSSTSFTIVPAVIGAGIIAIILSMNQLNKYWKIASICCLILFFLSYFHRKQSGLVVLIYMALALLYVSLKYSEDPKKAILKSGLVVCGVLALATLSSQWDKHYKAKLDGEDFLEYNQARSEFMDYPHDSYDDHASLYQTIGWNADTYTMADDWCFVDERIDADAFHYAHENSKVNSFSLKAAIKNAREDRLLVALIITMLFVAAASFVLVLLNGDRLELIIWGLNALLTISMLSYQLVKGRMIYRSVVVVLLPAFVIMTLLALKCEALRVEPRSVKWYVLTLLLFAGMAMCAIHLNHKVSGNYIGWESTDKNRVDSIYRYCIEHHENTYVAQVYTMMNVHPELIYPNESAYNYIPWGGSTYNSHMFRKQLAMVGIDSLNRDTFLDNNVYLVSVVDNEKIREEDRTDWKRAIVFYAFYRYIKEDYPDVVLEKVDTICEGVHVYQFRRQTGSLN